MQQREVQQHPSAFISVRSLDGTTQNVSRSRSFIAAPVVCFVLPCLIEIVALLSFANVSPHRIDARLKILHPSMLFAVCCIQAWTRRLQSKHVSDSQDLFLETPATAPTPSLVRNPKKARDWVYIICTYKCCFRRVGDSGVATSYHVKHANKVYRWLYIS